LEKEEQALAAKKALLENEQLKKANMDLNNEIVGS